jgi:hypothetical protein
MKTLVKPRGRRDAAVLDDRQRQAILAYCQIAAAASGALLSLKDLVELLAIDATEEEVEESIVSDEWLSERVLVQSGHVVLRQPGSDGGTAQKVAEEEDKRRVRALANVEAARVFARFLGREAVFVAVAGTNSYLSAGEGDDIDFYCITKTDTMWKFMLKSLLMSRVSSLTRRRRDDKPFCFSFVLDKRQAVSELSRPKDALFARDTLTSKVLRGGEAMYPILEIAKWMRSYFPSLYERKLRELRPPAATSNATSTATPPPKGAGTERASAAATTTVVGGDGGGGGGTSRVVNLFLFRTLGWYIYLRAWVLNRKLAKQGRRDATFSTRIGPGQLEYVSRRYVEIGKMYQALERR